MGRVFVQQNPDGSYSTVYQDGGGYEELYRGDQSSAENSANVAGETRLGQTSTASSTGNTGSDFSTGPGYGYLLAQMESQNQLLNQAYLRERMALIDVPMLEIEKDKLAWQKAQAAIANTGYTETGKPTFQRESFYANLLAQNSGPLNAQKAVAMLPTTSFGTVQGAPSWEGALWQLMQGTTPDFGAIRQPTDIKLSEYNQMTPSARDYQSGLWSAQGVYPQDAWEIMKRAAPTGQAAQNTVWR